jgi:hypothetical protein
MLGQMPGNCLWPPANAYGGKALKRKQVQSGRQDETRIQVPWAGEVLMNGEQPIHFANATLGTDRHICAFFHSPDEEYRVLLPFIREGIERGEKAFHIVDPRLRSDHFRRLRDAGIDADAAAERGQLVVKRWEDAYLRDGHFDQDRMLALIEEVLSSGPAEGYSLTRLVAHMEWALEDFPGVNDLVEYETRLNFVLPKYKDPVI